MRSKGIKSVQARVTNLTQLQPTLDIPTISNALVDSFQKIYGKAQSISHDTKGMDTNRLEELYQKYSSWDWRYGESPQFDLEINTRFTWGSIDIGLQLKNAKIEKAVVYSDAMDEAFIAKLPSALEGCTFPSKHVVEILRKNEELSKLDEHGQMINDIANWLETTEF